MTEPNRDHGFEESWAEPLAGQLATLRVWRQCVNVLAFLAGVALVVGVILWLAAGPRPTQAALTAEPIHNSVPAPSWRR